MTQSGSADVNGHATLRETLDGAIRSRDRAAAVKAATDAVTSGAIGIDDLYVRVLGPLMIEVGAAWQNNAERVWEEHFASSVVRTIVESLYLEVARESQSVPRLGQTVVLACPPGEQHDLGLRMLADRMMLAGWDSYFLGADTPVNEIVAAANALKADLVALAVATHFNRVELRQTLDALKALLPSTRIGVGGPAFAADPDWPQDEVLTDCNLGIVHDGTCDL